MPKLGLRSRILKPYQHKLALGSFKLCPLCGTLNVKSNAECFVCRWRGQFHVDPELLSPKVAELLSRSPAAAIVLGSERFPWLRRVVDWLFGFITPRLDTRV